MASPARMRSSHSRQLQAAARIAHGEVPYSDFWWFYPPGQPYMLGGLWELFGPSLLVWRIVRVLSDATVALLAWRLARRAAPEPLALAAAMQIMGASYVETLDTKGTDGSNVHLNGPDTITGSRSNAITYWSLHLALLRRSLHLTLLRRPLHLTLLLRRSLHLALLLRTLLLRTLLRSLDLRTPLLLSFLAMTVSWVGLNLMARAMPDSALTFCAVPTDTSDRPALP